MLVNGGWCHTVSITITGSFWRARSKIEQPILKQNVPWSWIDAQTRGIRCKMNQDLIVGKVRDREQDLEFEWWWRRCGRYCPVHTKVVLEEL
jgi:hypothetical protein